MKSKLIKQGDKYLRVLAESNNQSLVIDCVKRTMPRWVISDNINAYEECSESDFLSYTNTLFTEKDNIPQKYKTIMTKRFSVISAILPFIDDVSIRSVVIKKVSAYNNISVPSVRAYLCAYLSYMDKRILAPSQTYQEKALTDDEKNIRWGLNKFYYTKHKNSLRVAYEMTLKAKYCDESGLLLSAYPTFNQFRYFYKKTRTLQKEYISRNGIKYYQRNQRPLLGDGVSEFAPSVGTGMFDSTVCDIYLIDNACNLIGRPILTACIDAYSRICYGYLVSLEGGTYSLRGLINNMVSDKVVHCRRFGIDISQSEWCCSGLLPATFVTDMGREYQSEALEQIAELGVTVINLPPYRPELKSCVEKFFDIIQNLYKIQLKGKGVIEPDFQERGAHDYRKDACLTLTDFEKIIIHCILYYNNYRVIESFPYTKEMLDASVKPVASAIWDWDIAHSGGSLITVDSRVMLTILPRTRGHFERSGLIVSKVRYNADGFTERYLNGGDCTVAYNPDDSSVVWLIENGSFTPFNIIDSRYASIPFSEIADMQKTQRQITDSISSESLQEKLNLMEHITVIASKPNTVVNVKGVKRYKHKAKSETHTDFIGGDNNGT